MLKALLVALLATVTGSAHAATTTDAYLATKAKAIADLARPAGAPITASHDAIEAAALLELDRLIGIAIGPIRVRGFPAEGASNVVSLSDGYGESGHVDGLRAESADGTTLLLTTVPLVQAWLAVNAAVIAGAGQAPKANVAAALADGGFYTQAFNSDAAMTLYAEIPVATAADGPSVRAFLSVRSQDQVAPRPPDGLVVSVVRGDGITLFEQPVDPAMVDIPACGAAWTMANVGVQQMFADSRRTGGRAPTVSDAQAAADEAERAFLACYRDNVPSLPGLPALAREARDLVERTR